MIGVKKEGRIYVHCTSKDQYVEVLRWKAQQKHRWPKSQDLVTADYARRSEWDKYEKNTTLGIYNNGAMCRLEKARERGIVIKFDEFLIKYSTNIKDSSINEPAQAERPIRSSYEGVAPLKTASQQVINNNNKKENLIKTSY